MEQNFTLKKLTVETLGVSCQYGIQTTKDDDSVETAIYQKKDSRPPHLDLIRLFERGLASVIATVFHFDRIDGFALNQIVPTTIKFSGKNENVGIVISGYFISGVGKLQFKTSKIKYKAGESEFCAKLTVLVHDIEVEIQKYLFDNKVATVEEFGND